MLYKSKNRIQISFQMVLEIRCFALSTPWFDVILCVCGNSPIVSVFYIHIVYPIYFYRNIKRCMIKRTYRKKCYIYLFQPEEDELNKFNALNIFCDLCYQICSMCNSFNCWTLHIVGEECRFR